MSLTYEEPYHQQIK